MVTDKLSQSRGGSARAARALGGLCTWWSVRLAGVLVSGVAAADELNMPVGVTEISRSVYNLHMTIFWVCVVIGIVVFGVMFVSMIAHRKSSTLR